MNFLNRLKYYLIGVGLGILIVMSIFKDRKLTSWTPNNQVIKQIEEFPLKLSSIDLCRIECLEISVDSLKTYLLNGDVDFSSSDVHSEGGKIYAIEIESEIVSAVRIKINEESCEVLELNLLKENCDCHN